jgi:hypothetical protein
MDTTQPRNNFSTRFSFRTILVALMVGIFAFSVIIMTADDIGWTCDEVYYFISSELIMEWIQALASALVHGNPATILSQTITDQYWLWDIKHNPHPPLYKILTGVTLLTLKNYWGEFVAYRCAPALLSSVLVVCLFIILKNRYSMQAGLYGSLALLFMPRFFGDAHIGATEIPLTTFWLLACWSFWRGLQHVSGSVLFGIFWGCAIATKFTGLLIPAPLMVWSIVYRKKPAIKNMAVAIPFALLIPFVVNPGWWHDPIVKINAFLQASLLRHETIPIPTYFWGQTYSFSPPWIYAWVMTAITIPVTTIFTFILGMVTLSRDKINRSFNMLFFCNCVFPLFLTMLPKAPVHDGVRQFFYMLPFFAYFCGAGFYYFTEHIVSAIKAVAVRRAAAIAAFLLLTLYPAYQTGRIHPYELCYYNELVGGVRGAYALGMETTYWYDVVNKEFLELLNREIPQGAAVSMWIANQAYFEFLQDKGKIRKDIKFITPDIQVTLRNSGADLKFSPATPEFLILLSRQGVFNKFYWSIYKNSIPLYSLTLEGVPLISLYRWKDVRLF